MGGLDHAGLGVTRVIERAPSGGGSPIALTGLSSWLSIPAMRSRMAQQGVSMKDRLATLHGTRPHHMHGLTYCLAKNLPHTSQVNGRSFVCDRICRARCSAFLKDCEQMEHTRSSWEVLGRRCLSRGTLGDMVSQAGEGPMEEE